jgi:hypothetical protein
MTLTKTEAENILSKIFASDVGGTKVCIEDTAGPIMPVGPGSIVIHLTTLDRVLKAMAGSNLKIEAIKFYREAHPGSGLADAKAYVEGL